MCACLFLCCPSRASACRQVSESHRFSPVRALIRLPLIFFLLLLQMRLLDKDRIIDALQRDIRELRALVTTLVRVNKEWESVVRRNVGRVVTAGACVGVPLGIWVSWLIVRTRRV